jgi:hypothetical protein
MIRRPRRVVPAVLVALVLLAAAVFVIWSCVDLLLGRPPLVPFDAIARRAAALHGDELLVLAAGGVVAGLGLVLLACAWLPGVPNVLTLADVGDQTSAGVTRRSLRNAVARAAGSVDGVAKAGAKVGAGRVRATVSTPLGESGDLSERVRSAVGSRLTAIALHRAPSVKVKINRSRST